MYLHSSSRVYALLSTDSHVAKQTHPPREYAQHKAISGICVDPFTHHQLASYAEVCVSVYVIMVV